MTFPQYRKSLNGKHFYKIISEIEFEEIQLIGGKYLFMKTVAEIYPDKMRIQDMLHSDTGLFQVITDREFVETLNYCQKNKTLIA